MGWEIDFADMCRACMETDGVLFDMFQDDTIKDKNLPEKLAELTSVKVDRSDGLPVMLCGKCAYRTECFYDFKQQVRATEQKLCKMLNSQSQHSEEAAKTPKKKGRPRKKPAKPATPSPSKKSRKSQEDFAEVLEAEDNLIQILEEADLNPVIPISESIEIQEVPEPKKSETRCSVHVLEATKDHKKMRIETQEWQPLFTPGMDAGGEISDDEELEISLLESDNPEEEDEEPGNICGTLNDNVIRIKEICTKSGKLQYQCTLCLKNYEKLSGVLLHVVDNHVAESGPFFCMVCEKDCENLAQLRAHVKSHAGQFPYTCFLCNKAYSMKRYLKRHMVCHADFPRYRCPKCGVRFKVKSELEEHVSTHINGAPYECSQCTRIFNHKSNYKRHLISHHLDPQGKHLPKYPCKICGKRFLNNRTLVTHTRVHTGEKPFKCDTCEKSFSQQGNLINHGKIHTNPRSYTCGVCGKSFNQRATLRDHSMLHTGEKPYVCNVCDTAFTFSAALRRHAWSHAEDKPFRCDTCGAGFVGKYDLKRHMRIHSDRAKAKKRKEDAEFVVADYEGEEVLVEEVFGEDEENGTALFSLIQCG